MKNKDILDQESKIALCNECKFSDKCIGNLAPKDHVWCTIFEIPVENDWFCADGEPKEFK